MTSSLNDRSDDIMFERAALRHTQHRGSQGRRDKAVELAALRKERTQLEKINEVRIKLHYYDDVTEIG